MIEALDEISEIPFEVFWDKFMEIWHLSIYASDQKEPWKHLRHFDLPF
jgi:hypothetical protein